MADTGMSTIINGDNQQQSENINTYQNYGIGFENAKTLYDMFDEETKEKAKKLWGEEDAKAVFGNNYIYYDENGEKQNLTTEQYLAKKKTLEEEAQAKADAEAKDAAELAHQEEREDTAYQRMIKDMIAAGINPGAISITGTPSASSATNQHNATNNEQEKEILKRQQAFEELQAELEREFQKNENKKNRIWKLIGTILGVGTAVAGKAIPSKTKIIK